MKPNLFLVGASKCGTTFLHDALNRHPEIYMSERKELHFFTRDDWQEKMDWYEAFFSQASAMAYAGESTPTYSETTYFSKVPERIYEYNPNAKIIYLVRSPFDRLKSVYRQALSTGHWHEKKYYNRKMPLDYAGAVFGYPPFIEASRYYTHVQNYLAVFPENSLKVILFEDLVRDTTSTLTEIFYFLGVDVNVSIDLESAERNTGEGKTVYNPWLAGFRKLLPSVVLRALPEGARRLARNTAQALPVPDAPAAILSTEDETRVREILAPEVEGIYRYLRIENDPWEFFEAPREGSGPVSAAPTWS